MRGKALPLLALFMAVAALSLHQGFQPEPVSAAATLVIDSAYVANERLDIKDMTYLGIHVSYSATYMPLTGGKIYFEGITGQWYTNEKGWCIVPVTSWDPGRVNLTVEDIYIGSTSTDYEWIVQEPQAIFDRVDIELRSFKNRIGVDTEAPIIWDAHYASDDSPFTGQLVFNHNFTIHEVGPKTYEVVGVVDEEYGITEFQSDTIEFVFDVVNVTLTTDNRFLNVSDEAMIDWTAVYQYDGEPFRGWVEFNDSLTQTTSRNVSFAVGAVHDTKHAIESFASNVVHIAYDEVVVTVEALDPRIDVGWNGKVRWSAEYGISKEIFRGSVELNSETHTMYRVGSKDFYAVSVVDGRYGLTTFRSVDATVIWDRVNVELYTDDDRIDVGDNASIMMRASYEYDGTDVTEYVDVELTPEGLARDLHGERVYETLRITDRLGGIRLFETNTVKIVWDRVKVNLGFPQERVEVGSRAYPTVEAFYESDRTPFMGTIHYNDTMIQDMMGTYAFTVSSIEDPEYGIKAFSATEASCTWDKIHIASKISQFTPGKTRAEFEVSYMSDWSPVVNAELYLGKNRLRMDAPGKYILEASSLSPLIASTATVSSPGFEEELTFGMQLNLGNIGLYAAVLSAVAVFVVKGPIKFT